MTSESVSNTEPWVEKHGMEYAFAYDKSSALFRGVGAKGYPSAILVDPAGNIAYLGHPGSITESQIQAVLDGALAVPMFEWPKELAGVAKAVKKGDFEDAVGDLAKLGEGFEKEAAAVRAMLAARVGQVEKARDAGDWLKVETAGEALLKGLGKLEEAAVVAGILDALKKDKAAQEVLKAQKKVAKHFAAELKKNQFDRVQKDLEKIRDEFKGTAAERDARAGLERLKALRQG